MHMVCLAAKDKSGSNYVLKICFLGFWHNAVTWLSLSSHCTGHRGNAITADQDQRYVDMNVQGHATYIRALKALVAVSYGINTLSRQL